MWSIWTISGRENKTRTSLDKHIHTTHVILINKVIAHSAVPSQAAPLVWFLLQPQLGKERLVAVPRKIADTRATMRILNCSRWKLWDLTRHDPDFPRPRIIAGKNSWFEDELAEYMESRPQRQYAATADTAAS